MGYTLRHIIYENNTNSLDIKNSEGDYTFLFDVTDFDDLSDFIKEKELKFDFDEGGTSDDDDNVTLIRIRNLEDILNLPNTHPEIFL